MNRDRFVIQMERLHRTYGEKAYPKERMDGIWIRVKDFSEAQLEKAITWVITENFTPPSLSKILEALGSKGEGPAMQVLENPFACEPCRDFGFEWEGHTIIACRSCYRGRQIRPERLAKEQRSYDIGRKMFPMPGMGKPIASKVFNELPYDPKTSVAEIDDVEW
jgi:hypothetical protein